MPRYDFCQMCGGEKKVPCTDCKATGQRVTLKDGGIHFKWCTTCNKKGWRPCPDCSKTYKAPRISYIRR